MGRSYERLSIEDFGRQLIVTGDLDPVYVALNDSGIREDHKLRWLLAYSAFYHCGVASYISEKKGSEFWDAMMIAAKNEVLSPTGERWTRSPERRHFRGAQAVAAVQDWNNRYGNAPEKMYDYIGGNGGTFAEVAGRAKEHRSVGTWLGFKAADLVDATLHREVDQSNIEPFLYETPRVSLLGFWRLKHGYGENTHPKDEMAVLEGVVDYLKKEWSDLTIPHKPGEPIDMFTTETCACKHLSHLHGHYPLMKDTVEINEGLALWAPHSDTATLLMGAMPK